MDMARFLFWTAYCIALIMMFANIGSRRWFFWFMVLLYTASALLLYSWFSYQYALSRLQKKMKIEVEHLIRMREKKAKLALKGVFEDEKGFFKQQYTSGHYQSLIMKVNGKYKKVKKWRDGYWRRIPVDVKMGNPLLRSLLTRECE